MKLIDFSRIQQNTTSVGSSGEYVTLRNELTTRIGIMNTQAQTAMVTIFAIWGTGFILYAKVAELINNSAISAVVLIIISNFIFLVPSIYFIPLSIKSGENIAQIASLSAYIKIFYEYKSLNNPPLYNWETTNNAASNVNVNRGKKSYDMYHFNGEYTILSTLSLIIYILVVFSFLFGNYISNLPIPIQVFYIVLSLLMLVMGGANCLYIHKCSTMRNAMMKNTEYYFNAHLEWAREIGFLTEEEYTDAKIRLIPIKRDNQKN